MKVLNSTTSKNRYKYQSFQQRIKNIDIDVIHKVGKLSVPGEDSSYFAEAFDMWTELNLTVHFADFVNECKPFLGSFELLIFHKEAIFKCILKHLEVEDSLALEPLLNLLAVLSKDLVIDFIPFFKESFDVLSKCSLSRDPKIVEAVFSTIVYLLKHLKKYLIKDFHSVSMQFLSLVKLGRSKEHIIEFASKSLSFLVKSLKNDENFSDHIAAFIESNLEGFECDDFKQSVLVESCKSVNQTFHSCALKIMEATLRTLNSRNISIQLGVFKQLIYFSKEEEARKLWSLLIGFILRNTNPKYFLVMEAMIKSGKNYKLNSSYEVVYDCLLKSAVSLESISCSRYLALHSNLQIGLKHFRPLLDKICKHDVKLIFPLLNGLLDDQFEFSKMIICPFVSTSFLQLWKCDEKQTVLILSRLLCFNYSWRLLSHENIVKHWIVENLDSDDEALLESLVSVYPLLMSEKSCLLSFLDKHNTSTHHRALSNVLLALTDFHGFNPHHFADLCLDLLKNTSDSMILSNMHSYLKKYSNPKFDQSKIECTVSFLVESLVEGKSNCRQSILGILHVLSHNLKHGLQVISQLQKVMIENVDMNNYRDKMVLLRGLNMEFQKEDHFSQFEETLFISFVLGLISVPFRPIYKDLYNILKSCCERNHDLFWPICERALDLFESNVLDFFQFYVAIAERHNAKIVDKFFQAENWSVRVAYLSLLSKFKNLRSVTRIQELTDVFYSCCSKGDSQLQKIGLECILALGDKDVAKSADHLMGLLDEKSFRDELALFAIDAKTTLLTPDERRKVIPIVIRLLYGKMIEHKGKGNSRMGLASRRKIVMAFLVGLEEFELSYFIDLVLEPYSIDALEKNKEFGFLFMLEMVWKHLARRLKQADVNRLLNALFTSMSDDQSDKSVRKLGYKRLYEYFLYEVGDVSLFPDEMFSALISTRIPTLNAEIVFVLLRS